MTQSQREYHFGCVVPFFRQHWREQGYKFSKEDTHRYIKGLFFEYKSFSNQVSTNEYWSKVVEMQEWAASHFDGAQLPDPNEDFAGCVG